MRALYFLGNLPHYCAAHRNSYNKYIILALKATQKWPISDEYDAYR